MRSKWLQTKSARLTAVGFIVMTIAGNFMIVKMLFKEDPASYWVLAMRLGGLMVVLGGLSLAYQAITGQFKVNEEENANDE